MPDQSVPVVDPNLQPESICSPAAVLQFNFSLHFPLGCRLQQTMAKHCDIPLGELTCGHGQLSRGEEPPRTLLRSNAGRSKCVAHIASGVGIAQTPNVNVLYALHA